jgi:hypothetical protein
MKNEILRRVAVLTAFSVAMGLLEAAVVIYIRKLYYPEGFDFPLVPITDYQVGITELLREAATLVMLWGVGWLYGRSFITRLAAFVYSFAVWDIFYYVFLKLILGWPSSLLTPDVLFLLPVIWVGPVLAPVMVSLSMILFAVLVFRAEAAGKQVQVKPRCFTVIVLSAFVVFVSFVYDPSAFLFAGGSATEVFSTGVDGLFLKMSEYLPVYFPWWLFLIGQAGMLFGIIRGLKTVR